MALFGWYDPDKKKTATAKLREAIEQHDTKHGHAATLVLVNPETAAAIPQPPLGIEVRAVGHVALNTFFVGEPDDAEVAR